MGSRRGLMLGGLAILAVAGAGTAQVARWSPPAGGPGAGLANGAGQQSLAVHPSRSPVAVEPAAGDRPHAVPPITIPVAHAGAWSPRIAGGVAAARVIRPHFPSVGIAATPPRSQSSDPTSGIRPGSEHGDAPLRAGAHPFERPAVSDLRLNDPARELAIWYDPTEFPAGPVRFSLPEQGPACVLTVRGSGSIVERARIDGVPVVPGRSYVVEPGMRFEAPGAVDLQIRPAKPADLPGAPQGAG